MTLATDRAPESLAAGTPQPLRRDLTALLGSRRVLSRALDLVRYASDASPYRLLPRAVVMARDAGDVSRVLDYGRRTGTPVTLRAAGTSLNGQAQGDGILVDVRRHFGGISVEPGGELARVGPGTVLGHANRVLAGKGRRLGPDPASHEAATIGGVIANNSGGMRCGVRHDSYSTLRSLSFVLPSGTAIDTAEAGAEERFVQAEPELTRGLEELRDEIRADGELSERIRRKFEIKNTTGYRLCAFLDADSPLEIFRRLLVGSEGTLGFVSEAVFETIPLRPHTATAWIHFEGIEAATRPVPDLVAAGASAVELMLATSLIVASHSIAGTPSDWRDLPPDSAALLVEFRSDAAADLDPLIAAGGEALAGHETIRPFRFTRDPATVGMHWRVREGMFGLVGVMRPAGTSLITEDVCVPPQRIAEAAGDIQALLTEHGFLPGVAGHASAGNLHFMLTPSFGEPADRERYEEFISALVGLVVDKYDGSLKAEHGTGRNMAPYVEREWGGKATEAMWRVKRLADPGGVLSPEVLLSRDPGIHLKHLKSSPPIEEAVTSCVECGMCEPACPSRLLTTTPRERIVLRREIARQPQGSALREVLIEQYRYDGVETCAADGSCALACPLGIDTGKLIKGLRCASHSTASETAAIRAARGWGSVERAARGGLRAGGALAGMVGDAPLRGLTRAARRSLGTDSVPEWVAPMPPAAPPILPPTSRQGAAAAYVPACVNRIFGRSGPSKRLSLPQAMVEVSRRAGMPVWIPPDVTGSCCGVPWSSKGHGRAAAVKANEMVDRLWRWSGEAGIPVVIDASSCTRGVAEPGEGVLSEANAERLQRLELLDSVAWAQDLLDAGLAVRRRVPAATVHPSCSLREMELTGVLERVVGALAEEVHVPVRATCCGFAGDRGFLHPELSEAATREEAEEVRARPFDAHLCSNRTCEIGLERATGRPYESVVFLLEELTRPAAGR